MKVIDSYDLPKNRIIKCPNGSFVSNRILLKEDSVGFSLTRTVIKKGIRNFWHYKNHYESNTCISGHGWLENATTGQKFEIKPGITYVLDKHDPHFFEADEDTVLICVFFPALIGEEIHDENGSYPVEYQDYQILNLFKCGWEKRSGI